MKPKVDKLYIGLLLGILAPSILMVVYWQYNYDYMNFDKFIRFTSRGEVHVKLISLFTIANLGVFFLFIWRNYNMAARGVLLSTFLYTMLVVIVKFF